MISRLGGRSLALAAVLMLLLLAVLAVLQYRWVGQVSRAQAERMRRSLEIGAERIARDFDREISRAFFCFHVPPGSSPSATLAQGLEWWQATAEQPEILAGLYLLARNGTGGHDLLQLDDATDRFEPIPWPAELGAVRQLLDRDGSSPGAVQLRGPVVPSLPALLLALRPGAGAEDEGHTVTGWILVAFDRQRLTRSFLPQLVATHLGPEMDDVQVTVVAPGRHGVVWSSHERPVRPARRRGDAVRPLFQIRPLPELRALGLRRRAPGLAFIRPQLRGPREGSWRLVLARAEGSLAAAVDGLRRRNLTLALFVLVLLGAAAALLVTSARQVWSLSRRRMEFVAGVTHELNTPLAAITSAADNLADGLVAEPEHVRRYGELIQSESRRLSALVARVLDFAGSATAEHRVRPEPVDAWEVVEEVLRDQAWLITQKGFEVELQGRQEAPRVLADRAGLRRALGNVVGNALKYGEQGRWLGIESRVERHAGEERLALRVRDRGPGVPRAERRRIFEPFYRGADAAGAHVHGSGLGLAVARRQLEAFGGTLQVETPDAYDAGASFLVTLPLATSHEPPEGIGHG